MPSIQRLFGLFAAASLLLNASALAASSCGAESTTCPGGVEGMGWAGG